MTQEEKSILFKDLSARLPYGVIVKYRSQEGEGDVQLGCGNIGYVLQLGNGWWKECKPYLRPMSSMTEEEEIELCTISYAPDEMKTVEEKLYVVKNNAEYAADFYNKHHFDYRGLIEKGLAIEAPKGMYK